MRAATSTGETVTQSVDNSAQTQHCGYAITALQARNRTPHTAATQMAHPCNRCPSAPKSPYNRTKCVWMRRQRYKYCEPVEALTHFVRTEASQQHRRRQHKRLHAKHLHRTSARCYQNTNPYKPHKRSRRPRSYPHRPLGVNKQNPTADITEPRHRLKRRRRDSAQITCPG